MPRNPMPLPIERPRVAYRRVAGHMVWQVSYGYANVPFLDYDDAQAWANKLAVDKHHRDQRRLAQVHQITSKTNTNRRRYA